MILPKLKTIGDICIQTTNNAMLPCKGRHLSLSLSSKLPSPTSLPDKHTQYLCARSKGCHVECLHIDLETFSLGKRINNITMQGGNRYYQLQIALKVFEKYTICILRPMAWNSLKRHTVKPMLRRTCNCIEMVKVLWSLTSVSAQEMTQGHTIRVNHLQQHVKHCEEFHLV